MPELTIRAHDKQRQFLASTAPNIVFQGGAGSGKTWTGVLWTLLQALKYPGVPMMYVSPTFSSLHGAVVPHLTTIADQLGQLQTWNWHKSQNLVTLANGSNIRFRSADRPESLLGPNLAKAFGDEVALWKRLAYENLQTRLRVPGFGQIQAGYTITPKGRTWSADTLLIPREGLEIIKATTFDNPALPTEYFTRLKVELREGSLIWRQEVLGEVVAWQGLVYPSFSIDKHVFKMPDDVKPVATIYGVDWGWTNPGVIVVGQLDADDNLWIVEEQVHTELEIPQWAEIGNGLVAKYGKGQFWCDPSEPGNITAFRRARLFAERANNKVLPGITALGARFNNGTIFIDPSCEEFIKELHAYSYKQRQDGTTVNDEPVKVSDHVCDATRYLNLGIIQPRR